MNKFHIAISTNKIEETVVDYTVRLSEKPCYYVNTNHDK
jgi:hypothetical protein